MTIKDYEALYILDTGGKEETVGDVISRIESEIRAAGGTVRGVQKMDRRRFERTAGRLDSGFFVNIIFSAPSETIGKLKPKLTFDPDVYRQFYVNAKPGAQGLGGAAGDAKEASPAD